MKYFLKWLKWILKGKPMITYPGYNCGCCGKWIEEEFSIPEYKSEGEYWDTIGLCKDQKVCVRGD